jgi:hypothetical protein
MSSPVQTLGTAKATPSAYRSRDVLCHRGKQFDLVDQPLEKYFSFVGQRPCEGDYIAHWEIEDGWLYLTHLACVKEHNQPLSLQALFPFAGRRVFAAWFSGQLRGFKSERTLEPSRGVYPDLVLNLNCGHVETISLVHSSSKQNQFSTRHEKQASTKVDPLASNVFSIAPTRANPAEIADASWNPGWSGALV